MDIYGRLTQIQGSDFCLLMEGSKNSGLQFLPFSFIHITLDTSIFVHFYVNHRIHLSKYPF